MTTFKYKFCYVAITVTIQNMVSYVSVLQIVNTNLIVYLGFLFMSLFFYFFQESGNKEAKSSYTSERDIDMLPEWEKEKYKSQNRSGNENLNDDARKLQNAALVPVVKDASEFRELTKVIATDYFSLFIKKYICII